MLSAGVHFDNDSYVWRLQLNDSQYRFGLRDGCIAHLGFDSSVENDNPWDFVQLPTVRLGIHSTWPLLASEILYAVEGKERFDGFEMLDSNIESNGTPSVELSLISKRDSLAIKLRYELFPDIGIVARSAQYRNAGRTTVHITNAPSFRLRLSTSASEANLKSLFGDWSDECQLQQVPLLVGTTILENRIGRHFTNSPWFTVSSGQIRWFGQLAYSGNWQIEFLRDITGTTTVTGGMNPRNYRHALAPGESLQTPRAILGFTKGNDNAVSQALHGYQRSIIPSAEIARKLPVVFDNFFPFAPKAPSEEQQYRLADKSAELGCEVFLVDAGWFKNAEGDQYRTRIDPQHGSWTLQRGDWLEDSAMFPNGLSNFADHVRARGMGFGIWMEPETVVPGSAVLRDHPDWVYTSGGRPLTWGPQGHLLRLGLPEVREWVFAQVDRVIRAYAPTYFKWDFNNDFHTTHDSNRTQNELDSHIDGLYELWDRMRIEHPEIVLENCASGGGRLDAGAMAHAHVTCLTDKMTPIPALGIRFGSSHAYVPGTSINWLVHWPQDWQWMKPNDEPWDWTDFIASGWTDLHGDLDFRARIVMLGSFGISAPIHLWSEEDSSRVAHHISTYKQLRPLLFDGDVYRLTDDPARNGQGGWAALCYVDAQHREAALFAFRLSDGAPKKRFTIPGLSRSATYSVLDDNSGLTSEASGEELLERGVVCVAESPFRSALYRVNLR